MELELKRHFYKLHKIDKKTKDDIIKELGITNNEYIYLRRVAVEWDKTKINTKLVEKRVIEKYLINPNDEDNWKDIMTIWATKHKVPTQESLLDFEVD